MVLDKYCADLFILCKESFNKESSNTPKSLLIKTPVAEAEMVDKGCLH